MAYRQRWQSIRMRYEHQYAPADTREVTVRRVVNVFERTGPGPPAAGDYDRQFQEDTWFDDGPGFPPENCPRDMNYPSDRYYDGNPDYGNFHRNSPPHHQEPHYQRPHYDRDDLRHQIRGRKNGRPGPYFNNRGRGHSHNRDDQNHFRYSQNAKGDWDRSSGKKKNQPSPKKNVPPEAEKGAANAPKAKPAAVSTPPPSVPAEEPPQTSSLIKEKTCDAELEKKEEEEVAPSSVEPEKTQNEELKARRSEAIKAKALEIEKHHRQDCETFGTVVKMLVSKEPTLENLIHNALNANLSEMRQHCLAALRHYVKELDEALESNNTT